MSRLGTLLRRPGRATQNEDATWAGLGDDAAEGVLQGGRRVPGPPRPGVRGWAVLGGGRSTFIQPPPAFHGTTVQVCGLWPWATGSAAPIEGVPLGRHLYSDATVCCDPIQWFRQTNLIDAPSAFMLADPGLGKSKLAARMIIGLAATGVTPMVLGDLRPDYTELIRGLGGQVIELGPGRSVLNVLDPGGSAKAVQQLRDAGFDSKASQVEADAHRRRVTMVFALLAINRGTPLTDVERALVGRALRILDQRRAQDEAAPVPVLSDLLAVVEEGPAELRRLTLSRDDASYEVASAPLQVSLNALIEDDLGKMLGGHTTEPLDLAGHPGGVVFDVSSISDVDQAMQGGALMACWSAGFAAINASHALADAGLAPRRYYFAVLDELHRALRAGAGMPDRVDLLTRLNRRDGAGYLMITHTMSDLQSLSDPADVAKARGLVERSKIKIIGGLSRREILGDGTHPGLDSVVGFTRAETGLVTGWSTPAGWGSGSGSTPPPGRGKFLIKVGQRPGIPVQTVMTRTEMRIKDTNEMWQQA